MLHKLNYLYEFETRKTANAEIENLKNLVREASQEHKNK